MGENTHPEGKQFEYAGFKSPNGTIVPDDLFDVLMPQLKDGELRVLLYIIRKTFGWKKDSDDISLSQMVNGVVTKDGRVQDRGTGLKKSAVTEALKGLRAKKIIKVVRNRSVQAGNEPTTYMLRFEGEPDEVSDSQTPSVENGLLPLSGKTDKGLSANMDKGLSGKTDTQETSLQTTEISLSNIRNGTPKNHFVDNSVTQAVEPYQTGSGNQAEATYTTNPATSVNGSNNGFIGDPQVIERWGMEALGDILQRKRGRPSKQEMEEREMIQAFIKDFAHEFRDRALLKSSVTRAYNIYKQSGMHPGVFQDCLYQARLITKDYQSRSLIKESPMAYYFRVLEDKSGVKEHPYNPPNPN